MAKKTSSVKPKSNDAPEKKSKATKQPKIEDEEEDEDEDEELNLDEDEEEEDEEEDLDEINDEMLAGEDESERQRSMDEVEQMLRETECASCSGSSSKLKCKVRTDYGCPPDKADK